MAVDNRPFKSKEQDGQGNEVIIRDQQLVEQGTATTMPAGTYFQTLDVDGRPVKIPKDNMLNLIVEGLGIIFSGQSDQQTVTKVPTLNGNNFGASTVATLASVLGAYGATEITSLSDMNDLTALGKAGVCVYFIATPSTPSNMPTDLSQATRFFAFVYKCGTDIVQEVQARGSNVRYRRTYDGTSWTDWSCIYDSSMLNDASFMAPLASALGVGNIYKFYKESGGFYLGITASSTNPMRCAFFFTDNGHYGVVSVGGNSVLPNGTVTYTSETDTYKIDFNHTVYRAAVVIAFGDCTVWGSDT